MSFCLAFSGCTVFETDTEALMHPPVFSEEQAKLNEALTSVIGEDYNLKYPASGGTNSAFIFKDLDDDGTEEAMAFYSTEDDNTRINILKRSGEGWLSVYEAAGFSGDIESIDFANVDEKSPAVVIKWETEIGIYRFENERLERLHSSECYGFDIADMDGDRFSDIIIFKGMNMDRSILNIFHNSPGGPVLTEDVAMYAEYSEIYSAKAGKLFDGQSAYFIDSSIYDGVYLTEIITLNDIFAPNNSSAEEADESGDETEEAKPGSEEGKTAKRYYISDFVEDESVENTEEQNGETVVVVVGSLGKRWIFTRNTAVSCMDTNGDGIMEFPVEVREDYAREASETVFYFEYMQFDGTVSVPVWHGIANTESGYLFSVPNEWNTAAEVSIDSASGELCFTDAKTGEPVLKIHRVLKSDYQDKYENYVLAAENGDYNYYIEALSALESNLYIDPADYRSCFTFI